MLETRDTPRASCAQDPRLVPKRLCGLQWRTAPPAAPHPSPSGSPNRSDLRAQRVASGSKYPNECLGPRFRSKLLNPTRDSGRFSPQGGRTAPTISRFGGIVTHPCGGLLGHWGSLGPRRARTRGRPATEYPLRHRGGRPSTLSGSRRFVMHAKLFKRMHPQSCVGITFSFLSFFFSLFLCQTSTVGPGRRMWGVWTWRRGTRPCH